MTKVWNGGAAAMVAALLCVSGAAAQDITLTGEMTYRDLATYREVPFKVPAGVTAVTVEFSYQGREERSVIDLGVRDSVRFRGWSGGARSRFVVAETYATPSYLPGPIPAGEWRLVLGVPAIRETSKAPYTAKIWFERRPSDFQGFATAPLKDTPGWYRGDLHLHSAHSDGSCAAQSGARVPCPLFRTTEAAAQRGLDFIAVTEHNTVSHQQGLTELQPYYDRMVLIPGREITTFQGHANVFGATAPLDFQLGGPRAPKLGTLLDQLEKAGGIISVNHPGLPSGEACMGCGWTAETDWRRVAAIEAINGGALKFGAEGPGTGIPFWEARLNQGFRLTGVGGSDNHDGPTPLDRVQSVGSPTTVVYAENLSQPALLAGIRSGRVFVDVEGTRDRLLDVTATAGGQAVHMGGVLKLKADDVARVELRTAGLAGGHVTFAGSAKGLIRTDTAPFADGETRVLELRADGARGWLRIDVRGPDGKLWILGNPIYLEPPGP
ncbi:CehA/McbA family metallohydrolase [Phenylobacterium sp. J426]|uniref:CehA/McbA family metallohydrolase n=1 Tax=Phenylobacterium sp. J426 TaxID=2898439 RepID=UPI0021519E3A|nr:CehA/McbA family metallohydrolase [Phenylobacterium sp. J426]MCR5874488.1 CehA/McbA family metallohydrolase [Phenylobacterium sp. J426]